MSIQTEVKRQNEHAERGLLESLLAWGLEAPPELVGDFSAEDIFDPTIRELWEIFADAYLNGWDFSDPPKTMAAIKQSGNSKTLWALYSQMLSDPTGKGDWKWYKHLVQKDAAARRAKIKASQAVRAIDAGAKPAEVLEMIEGAKLAIESGMQGEKKAPTVADMVIEAAKDTVDTGPVKLIPLGVSDIDSELGKGIEQGEIVIIGGIESHGKTALAMHIIHHWTGLGLNGVFVSIEMPIEIIGRRALKNHSDLAPQEWHRHTEQILNEAIDYARRPGTCYIVDQATHIRDVVMEIEKHIARYKCEFVVVDYIQLLSGNNKNTIENIRHYMQEFIRIKKKHRVTLVLLSQVNKEMRNRKVFYPRNEDLADSAEIRRGADVVIFTVIPGMIDQTTPKDVLNIYVTKNRDRGVKGNVVECRLNGLHQRITGKPVEAMASYEESFNRFNKGEVL